MEQKAATERKTKAVAAALAVALLAGACSRLACRPTNATARQKR